MTPKQTEALELIKSACLNAYIEEWCYPNPVADVDTYSLDRGQIRVRLVVSMVDSNCSTYSMVYRCVISKHGLIANDNQRISVEEVAEAGELLYK